MNASLIHRWAHRAALLAIVAVAPSLAACSHHHVLLTGFDTVPVAIGGAQGRRVAFVVGGLPADFTSRVLNHFHHVDNLHEVYARTAYTALEGTVDTVRFFDQAPASGYDLIVYPGEVSVTVAVGALVSTCTVNHELKVTDAHGVELARGAGVGVVSGEIPVACVIALSNAFRDAAIRSLTAAQGRVASAAPPSTTRVAFARSGGKQ